jgi:hypothetical protein
MSRREFLQQSAALVHAGGAAGVDDCADCRAAEDVSVGVSRR